MEQGSHVRPRISVLAAEQIEQVHSYSLQILATTGIRVDSQQARHLFARAGAELLDDRRVRLGRELVDWALGVAPACIDVYDRRGNPAFCLGDGRTRFGIGVTNLYYQDPETDAVTPFTRAHMALMSRLGDALPYYDVVSTVGIVQDVSPETLDLYGTLEMMANTTKPLVVLVSDEHSFPAVLDLLEHLHGELAARPFIVPYFNPISPLVMNEGTLGKVFAAVERGLPFIYSNYGMAGATTPITPAGTLALLNAELLAGLVLTQLIREGAPVILGSLPAFFDMRGMGSFYDVHSIVLNLACAAMMASYGLPHAGLTGSGTGWGPDLIAATTNGFAHPLSCMGKVGLAPFAGANLGSLAFSPASAVYVHEVIAQAIRMAEGFVLDDAKVGLDEIAAVGPGGNFLTTRQTLERMRDATYHSPVFPHLTLERWQAQGQPTADAVLRRYTRQLLATLTPPEDHKDLIACGEAFIQERAGGRR